MRRATIAPEAGSRLLPIFIEIDLDALRHNARQVRLAVGRQSRLLAVVKGDAYGHGAVAVSRVLAQEGVNMLGVTRLQEAIDLRDAGVRLPILIMGGVAAHEAEAAVDHDLRSVVFDRCVLERLGAAASRLGKSARVHIKIDTGLGRLGFKPTDALEVVEELAKKPSGIVLEGLMTHFADVEGDPESTATQLTRFRLVVEAIRRQGIPVPLVHASNSAGIFACPEARFDMVRCGILFYGYADFAPGIGRDLGLRPLLQWKARIVQVRSFSAGHSIGYGGTFTTKRPSRIAVLSVGYADGMSRSFSNSGTVLISGRRAPVIGRISMDMMTVDVTDLPETAPGDEVVLIGRQGGEIITAQDLADQAGTLVDDVLCGISWRVPRVYSGEA